MTTMTSPPATASAAPAASSAASSGSSAASLPAAGTQPPEAVEARVRILDNAARLILDKGFAATSMRDIASAVGIKAGSLYHHFASKEEIFTAILERGIDVMVTAFESVENDDRAGAFDGATSAEALLRAHVRAHLGSLFEFGPYTAAHVTTFHNAPDSVHEIIVPRRDSYEAMWAALFDRLQAQGSLRVDHLSIARLVLFGGMNSTIEWFDPAGPLSLDDLADTIVSQFWHAGGHA